MKTTKQFNTKTNQYYIYCDKYNKNVSERKCEAMVYGKQRNSDGKEAIVIQTIKNSHLHERYSTKELTNELTLSHVNFIGTRIFWQSQNALTF